MQWLTSGSKQKPLFYLVRARIKEPKGGRGEKVVGADHLLGDLGVECQDASLSWICYAGNLNESETK